MAWKCVKKDCYVVTTFYRDELVEDGEAPISDEDVVFSYDEDEKIKEQYEAATDVEEVFIDEDEREFWEC